MPLTALQEILEILKQLKKEKSEEYDDTMLKLYKTCNEYFNRKGDILINILDLLIKYKIALTKSEAKRLVLMGVIEINGMVYNGISDHILYNKTKLLIIKKGSIEYRILHDKVEVIK